MMSPITLKTNTTLIDRNLDIEDIIGVSLRYNTYNIIILANLVALIIFIIVYSYIKKITLTSNIMIELERLLSEQTLTLT